MIVRYLNAAIALVCGLLAQATPVAIFAWYVLYEQRPLEPAVAFASLAWINQLSWSINALPAAFQLRAFLLPSLQRLAHAITQPPSS